MRNGWRLAPVYLLTPVVLLLLAGCSGGEGPAGLLQSRVEASFEVTAKVTYEMALDFAPEDGTAPNTVSLTITQGQWGRRSDTYASTGTRTVSGSMLDLGGEQYICGRYMGLDWGNVPESQVEAWEEGFCYRGESIGLDTDEILGPMLDFTFSFREALNESDELEWTPTSSRSIAGIAADCFRVTSPEPEPADGEICFSEEGILLSIEASSPERSGSIVALGVDRHVQEDDFALPYPIMERP